MNQTALEQEFAEHMVQDLNLEITATEIDPETPLFGDEGLGLDSIDALEIGLSLSQHYGIKVNSNAAHNEKVFNSLRSLCNYIEKYRTNG